MRSPHFRTMAEMARSTRDVERTLMPLNALGVGSMASSAAGVAARAGGNALAKGLATRAIGWGGRFAEGVSGATQGSSRLSQLAGSMTSAGNSLKATGHRLLSEGASSAYTRSLSGVLGRAIGIGSGRAGSLVSQSADMVEMGGMGALQAYGDIGSGTALPYLQRKMYLRDPAQTGRLHGAANPAPQASIGAPAMESREQPQAPVTPGARSAALAAVK